MEYFGLRISGSELDRALLDRCIDALLRTSALGLTVVTNSYSLDITEREIRDFGVVEHRGFYYLIPHDEFVDNLGSRVSGDDSSILLSRSPSDEIIRVLNHDLDEITLVERLDVVSFAINLDGVFWFLFANSETTISAIRSCLGDTSADDCVFSEIRAKYWPHSGAGA